ncbi:hypothetical protein ETH_00012815, partial [Eimeria tenella]
MHCASYSGCSHFSFHLDSGECTLWSSFNTYSSGSSTQGLVSGPAFCDSEEICFEQSDYVGHNVEEDESGEVASAAACQLRCRENPDCHFWTWLRSSKGCYLKDANALLGRTNDASSLGRFSGPKWCTVSYGCIYANAVYSGTALQSLEAEDYASCGASCGANPFCSAWTFHPDLNLCSLFSGSVTLSKKPVRGALSAEKDCLKESQEETSCFEQGIQYALDKVVKVTCSSSTSSSSSNSSSSNSSSSISRTRYCTAAAAALAAAAAAVTARTNTAAEAAAAPTDPAAAAAAAAGAAAGGGFVCVFQIGEASSAFECYLQCQQESSCNRWTLKNGESCVLLGDSSSSRSSSSMVFDPLSVSGPRVCGSQVPLARAVSSEGAPLASATVFSPQGCLQRCMQTPQCENWSFLLGAPTNCLLFDKTATFEPGNAISGTLPRAFLASACSFENAQVLGTAAVASAAECAADCRAHPLCRAWTAQLRRGAPAAQGGAPAASQGGPPGAPAAQGGAPSSQGGPQGPRNYVACSLFDDDSSPVAVPSPDSFCGTALDPESLKLETSLEFDPAAALFSELLPLAECAGACARSAGCEAWVFELGGGCTGLAAAAAAGEQQQQGAAAG